MRAVKLTTGLVLVVLSAGVARAADLPSRYGSHGRRHAATAYDRTYASTRQLVVPPCEETDERSLLHCAPRDQVAQVSLPATDALPRRQNRPYEQLFGWGR